MFGIVCFNTPRLKCVIFLHNNAFVGWALCAIITHMRKTSSRKKKAMRLQIFVIVSIFNALFIFVAGMCFRSHFTLLPTR